MKEAAHTRTPPIANGEMGTWSRLLNQPSCAAHRRKSRGKRPQAAAALSDASGFAPLTSVAASQWRALAEHAVEPNGYYLARLGIGGERLGARPHRRLRAQRLEQDSRRTTRLA